VACPRTGVLTGVCVLARCELRAREHFGDEDKGYPFMTSCCPLKAHFTSDRDEVGVGKDVLRCDV
jgi:hypothetical protein